MNADQNQPRDSRARTPELPPARAAMTAFIDALRQRLRDFESRASLPQELEQTVRQVVADDDLPTRFTRAATSVGLEVHAGSPTDWMDVIADILRKHEAHSVVVQLDTDSPLGEHATAELGNRLTTDGFEPTTVVADETLFSADAAVTSVAAAIAETGTIVCPSGPDLARGASLLPPIHVAVVQTSQLVPDQCDYFDQLAGQAGLPANINLITGPSKTADIEGILVTGVHGPRHVHVVLVSP
ncbi:MAG TPA: lactate utilization protein C [Phycisphaerae bacterium]|nr:lactate utilization protein C [Phycisphaerae bacterium]